MVSLPTVVLILILIAGLSLVVTIITTNAGTREEDLGETVGIDLIMEADNSIAVAKKPIV